MPTEDLSPRRSTVWVRGSQSLKTRSHIRPFVTRGPPAYGEKLLKFHGGLLTVLLCLWCMFVWVETSCGLLDGCQHLTSFFTLKMEAIHFPETLVSTCKIIQCHSSEDHGRHFSPPSEPEIAKIILETGSHISQLPVSYLFTCWVNYSLKIKYRINLESKFLFIQSDRLLNKCTRFAKVTSVRRGMRSPGLRESGNHVVIAHVQGYDRDKVKRTSESQIIESRRFWDVPTLRRVLITASLYYRESLLQTCHFSIYRCEKKK